MDLEKTDKDTIIKDLLDIISQPDADSLLLVARKVGNKYGVEWKGEK